MRATDDGEVVQVLGDDGEATASKSGGTIVHERAVVVGHAEVVGATDLVEVVSEKRNGLRILEMGKGFV